MTYIVYEMQKHRDTEMGNSVWAGVTWSRCGAVVAPSLTEYTIIHQSPLITDRFIPKHCIIDESVLCIQVYYALARPVVGNREVQSIIIQLEELYLQLWRQNLLTLEKFFNPNWRREKNSCHSGKKLLILLKFMNIWNCAWQNRRARVSMCGNLG